jgi:hypothetical protein
MAEGRWEQILVGGAKEHAIRDQNATLNRVDLCNKPPDSGELQYKSSRLKNTIWFCQKTQFGRWEQALVGAAVQHALRNQTPTLNPVDSYHKSPDSGELQYKSWN